MINSNPNEENENNIISNTIQCLITTFTEKDNKKRREAEDLLKTYESDFVSLLGRIFRILLDLENKYNLNSKYYIFLLYNF